MSKFIHAACHVHANLASERTLVHSAAFAALFTKSIVETTITSVRNSVPYLDTFQFIPATFQVPSWLFWRNSFIFFGSAFDIIYAYTLYYKLTLFCRSMLAPAASSCETTSVLPSLAASISADSPLCEMCSEN